MKYRPTFLNIIAGTFILVMLLFLIFDYDQLSSGEGWGVLAMIAFLVIGKIALVIDLIIQFATGRLEQRKRIQVQTVLGAIVVLIATVLLLFA